MKKNIQTGNVQISRSCKCLDYIIAICHILKKQAVGFWFPLNNKTVCVVLVGPVMTIPCHNIACYPVACYYYSRSCNIAITTARRHRHCAYLPIPVGIHMKCTPVACQPMHFLPKKQDYVTVQAILIDTQVACYFNTRVQQIPPIEYRYWERVLSRYCV